LGKGRGGVFERRILGGDVLPISPKQFKEVRKQLIHRTYDEKGGVRTGGKSKERSNRFKRSSDARSQKKVIQAIKNMRKKAGS